MALNPVPLSLPEENLRYKVPAGDDVSEGCVDPDAEIVDEEFIPYYQ